jgi:hypothetical protein
MMAWEQPAEGNPVVAQTTVEVEGTPMVAAVSLARGPGCP